MPINLRSATRTARKWHHCDICGGMVKIGEKHHVSTNVFDGRVYDFRTCIPCQTDRIVSEVYDWAGGPDEGVTAETAWEWAHEARHAGPGHPEIVRMANDLLRRAGCQCERCEELVSSPAQPDRP